MKQRSFLLIVVLMISSVVYSQDFFRWQKIAENTVDFRADKDIIKFKRHVNFSKIKLAVSNNDVHFEKMFIRYSSGKIQEVKVKDYIREGKQSNTIKLKHQYGDIREIVFYYDTPEKNIKYNKHNNGKKKGHNDRYYDNRNPYYWNSYNPYMRKAVVSVWAYR
jgi:hypothetical protein